MTGETRMELLYRPRCPDCGAADAARILWGRPYRDEALAAQLAAGAVVLGGCCVSEDDPVWECRECGRRFGRRCGLCVDADCALARLLDGNRRYRSETRNPAELTAALRRKTADEGQRPFAAVVCCADSRVPVEHVFSAGIGELFVIRNAGNVVSPSALASVEYAVGHLHVPLVLVLGHRGCGAVAAALSGHDESGALGALVAQVRANIGTAETPAEAELANLRAALAALRQSELLRQAETEGRVGIVGAIYDLFSGAVAPQGEAGRAVW